MNITLKKHGGWLIAILIVALAAAAYFWLLKPEQTPEPPVKSLTGLEKRMDEVKIEKLTIDPNNQTVLVDEQGDEVPTYAVATPALGDEQGLNKILQQAREQEIEIAAEPFTAGETPFLTRLIQTAYPFMIIALIILVILYLNGGFGKMNVEPAKSNTTFKDIAGVDEAINELEDIRAFLSDPDKFERLGAKVPKGVLLYGPPGTGKTLLAKAVAKEADIPFFSVSGSEFVEMFAGLGAKRVKQLFKVAKSMAPSIIFVDELDAVGGHRSVGGGDGGSREADQTLIQLLKEMDGFEASVHPVIVIGATNRLEKLDPALTRPGRFDRHIPIDPPNRHGRLDALKVHSRNKPMADDVDLKKFANRTAGMTGADLAALLNEAALLAARKDQDQVTEDDLEAAYFKVVAGVEKYHQTLSEKERKTVAYHEAGHAIVRETLKGADIVHKISIIQRGRSGGQTVIVSEEDVFLYSTQDLRDTLAGLLAGRAAEEIIFGEISSGAADDLDKASKLAEQMVTKLGMGQSLGLLVEREGQQISAGLQHKVESEIRDILEQEYQRASKLLNENQTQMKAVASALLREETIDRERFLQLLQAAPDLQAE